MNILYLTWGENIIKSGLFEGQVMNNLVALAKTKQTSIYLVSGVPMISRKTLCDPKDTAHFFHSVKKKLYENGIEFKLHWLPVLSTWFYAKPIFFPLYFLFHFFAIKRYVRRKKIDVIHCRSYLAAVFGVLLSKATGTKMIFDTRGAFPEEGVYQGFIAPNGTAYRFWKWLEKKLISHSDKVISVSHEQNLQYKNQINENLHPENKFEVVRTAGLNFLSENNERSGLAYVGVLGANSWYCFNRIALTFYEFRKNYPDEKLYIYSKVDAKEIIESLRLAGVPADSVEVSSIDTKKELLDLLVRHRFGILPTKEPSDEIERKLIDILCGAKTSDYLACSLPLIVFPEAKELVGMVQKYEIGLIVDESESIFDITVEEYYRMQSNIERAYKEEFSPGKHIEKYIECYS